MELAGREEKKSRREVGLAAAEAQPPQPICDKRPASNLPHEEKEEPLPGTPFSSLVWPWHEGAQMVHRFVVGCAAVSPATRLRWLKSVRSWREPWLQTIWVYDAAELALLEVVPNARVLIRNACIVIPEAEFSEWKARGFPIPLIKDLFQLKCLHMFGGWWADMDYFMLQPNPPQQKPGTTWLLATEHERRASKWRKKASATMKLGEEVVSVNLGIMWAQRDSPLLQEAQDKARALWKGSEKVWSGHRAQTGYQAHQRLIMDVFARTARAEVMPPIATSPFPRWIVQWQTQLVGRELYGVPLPGEVAILAKCFTCNVWDGCWASDESDKLAEWVAECQNFAPGLGASSSEDTRVPTWMLHAAANRVAMSLPDLTESGVPVVIAFRAMAAAMNTIARFKGKATFAADWPEEDLACGFLSGALKFEWCPSGGEKDDNSCVAHLEGSLAALAQRFGLSGAERKLRALPFDLLYMDTELVELGDD